MRRVTLAALGLLLAACGGIVEQRSSSGAAVGSGGSPQTTWGSSGSDASGGSNGVGGSHTAVGGSSIYAPTGSILHTGCCSDTRSCRSVDDCVIYTRPGCCDGTALLGLSKDARCSQEFEAICPAYCWGSHAGGFVSDDGQNVIDPSLIVLTCTGGNCRTLAPACDGARCPSDQICVTPGYWVPSGCDVAGCSPLPKGCAAGSDECASTMCKGFAGTWRTTRDLYCECLAK